MTALRPFIVSLAAAAAAGAAHADLSLLDASMYPSIVAGGDHAVVGGVDFSASALHAPPNNFVVKTLYGQSGLGVTGGRTGDEIDVDETITMLWTGGLTITSFSVAVLFNGPEYADWAEIAQVKAYNGATLVGTGLLQVDASSDSLASFTGTGFGSVTNLALADASHGGAWSVANPFGSAAVTRLEFTAVASSLCGNPSCTNQSDFTLSTVSAVPEPQSVALLLAGLGAVGFAARRRRLA